MTPRRSRAVHQNASGSLAVRNCIGDSAWRSRTAHARVRAKLADGIEEFTRYTQWIDRSPPAPPAMGESETISVFYNLQSRT